MNLNTAKNIDLSKHKKTEHNEKDHTKTELPTPQFNKI